MRRIVGKWQASDVEEVTLTSEAGVSVSIMSYGARIRDWRVPVGGQMRPVVLGFDSVEPYFTDDAYFGAIAGRVANRIGGARFTLGGVTYALPANEGPNHLHGGPEGIARRVWTIAGADRESVRLTLHSPEGEMGYPGALDISVVYRLKGHRLDIGIEAEASAMTPVNIVQHNYFNLAGGGDVLDHRLEIAASAYTELGEGLIPTGAILPVEGSGLDFRAGRTLRGAAGEGERIDRNFVLATRRDFETPVAVLTAPDGSLRLRLHTDRPGLQVYDAWKLGEGTTGLEGRVYGPFSGICLEDQIFPDAINHPHFPDCVVTPGAPYRHRCGIEISG